MKKFLRKSSVITLILTMFIAGSLIVFATEISSTDDKEQEETVTVTVNEVVVIEEEDNVVKDSKTTTENYSNTIRVLVTPEQKQAVQSQLEELNDEIEMLAKVIYREARGESTLHQSAVVWTILNRVDANGYGDTITEVITAPNQFCWIYDTPVTEEFLSLAQDVVTRWLLEKQGIEDVGRTIPSTYKFFTGDETQNYFREEFNSTTYWDWSYTNPY